MSTKTIASILLVVVVGAGIWYYGKNNTGNEQVFCTEEAKLCPDGSYVGRQGPNCEFAACPSIQESPTGEVSVGETRLVNGVVITFNKIVQDSRCPLGVMCIQAGSVTANATLKSGSNTETVDLIAGAAAHTFGSFNVSLESVAPIRRQQTTIDPKEYVGTFHVEAL